MKLDHRTTQEVEQAGGDGRVVTQAHVHDQHARLDVHDAVLLRGVQQPVPEEGQVAVR